MVKDMLDAVCRVENECADREQKAKLEAENYKIKAEAEAEALVKFVVKEANKKAEQICAAAVFDLSAAV